MTTQFNGGKVLAWHFVELRNGKPSLCDGRPLPAVGESLRHGGEIEICRSGLHASERAIDALSFRRGVYVCRVECSDVVASHPDKFVCRVRTVVAGADATEVLRSFARWCALRVIDKWRCPDVVRRYLETGDELIRVEARDAAYAASYAAGAASYAAGAAFYAAYAAYTAAGAYAAYAAASSYAADAAASSYAADAAARSKERKAQNEELERRLGELLGLEVGLMNLSKTDVAAERRKLRKLCIREINAALNGEWSVKERTVGKCVDVPNADDAMLAELRNAYFEVGWKVWAIRNGRDAYLEFAPVKKFDVAS